MPNRRSMPAEAAPFRRQTRQKDCDCVKLPPAWVCRLVAGAALLLPGNLAAQPASAPDTQKPSPTTSAAAEPAATTQRMDENILLIRGNNTPEARKLGATRLLEIGGDEAVARLMSVLAGDPPDLAAQLAVCGAIADFERPPAALVEALLAMLGDTRPGVIEAVTRAIRRFDSTVVVGRLRPIAEDAAYARPRRMAAIRALGVLSDDIQAIGVLAGLLEDTDRAIRHAALAAFNEATGAGMSDPEAALNWWRRASSLTQEKFLKALIESRAQQVQRIRNDRSELTRRLVVASREAYLNTAEPNRPRFLQSLLADDVAALRLLGLDLVNDMITDRREINPETKARIVELTTDPDSKVCLRAARIVGDLRLSNAVTKLMEASSRELDDDVRAAQVSALGRLDDLSALPALIERLNDDAPAVVGEAAISVGTLLRRGQQLPPDSDQMISRIRDRYARLGPPDNDLREKFLTAMAAIGAREFRSIFEREMTEGRTPRIRRAAIAGLAGYEDAAAAGLIRPLTFSPDAEIRLAAIDALGKCGSTEDDLATLQGHLHVDREPDAAIRQHAWDSYLSVAQRLPAETRIRISDQFDRPDDKTAQRRRIELLRALRTDAARFEELPREDRIDVFERIADAQLELGEYTAASASLEQAMGLVADMQSNQYAHLANGSIAALLKGREDAAALKRVGEFFDGQQVNGELTDPLPIAETIRREVAARIAAAKDATGFAEARNLLEMSSDFARKAGEPFANDLAAMREELAAKRNADVSRLLDAIATDPEAESKLFQLGRQAVLPQVYLRLTRQTDATASPEVEARLLRLAKRLAPNWQGYEPNGNEEQRRGAMESLRETIESVKPEGTSVGSST